jgi:ABC-type phosphate/phosphonate transport system ATPase subunit
MTEQAKPWAGMGYAPVGAIVNKLLARYLRTQRKNMRRFFQERGLFTLADRMDQIRNSKQGMLAKNRMFQEVLNSYAKLTTPTTVTSVPGSAIQPSPVVDGETEAEGQ